MENNKNTTPKSEILKPSESLEFATGINKQTPVPPDDYIVEEQDPQKGKLLLTFFIWALLIANMFYQESMGLNALILTLASIPLFAVLNRKKIKNQLWWTSALIWVLAAVGVFINPNAVAVLAYILSFLFFTAVNNSDKISLPLGLLQSIFSFFLGFGVLTNRIAKSMDKKEKKSDNKLLIRILQITIPLVIGIIFLKLYQAADKTFYELTKFINLDWISWGFISFYGITCLLTFGFYYYSKQEDIAELEEKMVDNVSLSYTDKIQHFFGEINEVKIALSLLIMLNIMLLLYNAIDIRYILIEMPNPNRDLSFSEIVHGGINSLITSLILVIFIISFLFRGALNFSANKFVRLFGLIWLVQNFVMVTTTAIKNLEYVQHWGLTYKRIGVYVYLLLALVGITITIYKILKKKSFWFLMRNTSLAFAIVLTSLLTFNWNRAIASYNLSHLEDARIDFNYLLELGPDTFKYITHYHTHDAPVARYVLIEIAERKENYLIRHKEQLFTNEYSWRSYNWSDIILMQELDAIQFDFSAR